MKIIQAGSADSVGGVMDDAALHAFIDGDAALRAVLAEVRARMEQDAAHDEAHLFRVARWTVRLAASEGVDPRLAVAAALLHDVVNVPKTSPDRPRASELSADVARALLPTLGFSAADADEVAGAVRDHSFSRGAVPRTPLGRALQDADRLEALGALGVFRCIATGVRFGGAFFHEADPWAMDRALDDGRYSVDHFFTKLLRLPPTLLTEAGRAEAARRADAMVALLRQLGDELGIPLPEARIPPP
ncbi:MAG: metal-dependent phosphohydrolase sub protein [Gemmatimonadetes bacterium]|nr:metal-dependent phosphohydrolase sub protein [Gemmatimonadota bacterium]